jgi:hypothetical protein
VMRSCRSCTSYWYRADLDPDWDIDGCGHELCHACRAAGITDDDVKLADALARIRFDGIAAKGSP